jgi:hypothetical protein
MSPIRPENRDRYPQDWPQISLAVKERAGWRCECRGECGRGTHAGRCPNRHGGLAYGTATTVVVLTTAHLDHTPENCDQDNLRAMCQGCHLHYDRDHHARTAARTRAQAATAGMDPLPDLTPCKEPLTVATSTDLPDPEPPLYDEEHGLAEMAAVRSNPEDETTRHLLALAGQLARHMARHFEPGQLEAAGRALLIGAASCADLANDGVSPVLLVNLLGYTAERMVTSARTWQDDQPDVPDTPEFDPGPECDDQGGATERPYLNAADEPDWTTP